MQITFKECTLSFGSESFVMASKNIHVKIYVTIILFACVKFGISYLIKGRTRANGVQEQCAKDDGRV